MLYPNRRPLLISAILVALTSIPTMIVIAAGTASLHDRDAPRPPAIAGPNGGPLTVGPSPELRQQPSPDGEAGDIVRHPGPKASGAGGGQPMTSSGTGRSRLSRLQPPGAAPAPGVPGNAGSGSGSSGSSGSGSSGSSGSSGTGSGSGSSSGSGSDSSGSGSSGSSSSGSSSDGDADPEDCPTPTPGNAPSPGNGHTGATQRIDDQAWPGWDAGLTPKS
jgi:hypothetical protein